MTDVILTQLPTIPANAIQINDGKIFTTSFQIAKLFSKRHEQVLRKIKSVECSEDFTKHNFVLCFKINDLANNKKVPYYEITKDGFMFLVMGFTGKKAAATKEAYIKEFNRMAEELQKQQFLAIEQQQKRQLESDTSYLPKPMEIPEAERQQYMIINGMMKALNLKSDPVLIPRQDLVNALYPQMAQISHWKQMADCAKVAEERICLIMKTAQSNPEPFLDIVR